MQRRVRLVLLFLGIVGIVIFFCKPSKQGGKHDAFFQSMNALLQAHAQGQPALVVDLDRLEHNADAISSIVREGYALRIVVKSLPSLELLAHLQERTKARAFMIFHARFLPALYGRFGRRFDYLLGKPWPVEAARFAVNSVPHKEKAGLFDSVQWLVDSTDRLTAYLKWAKQEKVKLRVNLEIDVGLHRGGFGDVEHLKRAFVILQKNPSFLLFSGFMGYDGHVPYTPFTFPSQKTAVQRAFDGVLQKYKSFYEAAKAHAPALFAKKLTLNGGGSKTYTLYQGLGKKSIIRDISIGSAFLQPAHFDFYTLSKHRPAVFIGAPVIKKLRGNHVAFLDSFDSLVRWWDPNRAYSFYIYGGGWSSTITSPPGLFIEPLTAGLPNANLLPNQSLLVGSEKVLLREREYVFFRPMEGDALLNFDTIYAVRKGRLVKRWKSFPVRY